MIKVLKYLISIFVFLFVFTSKISAQVVINEFLIRPSSSQWIELYNKGNADINISGWVIDDDGSPTEQYSVTTGTILPSKKCISFQSGKFNWNTATADKVKLIDSTQVLKEEYSYSSAPPDNVTIGREIDGEGELVILASNTRGAFNVTGQNCLAPTPTPTFEPTATPTYTPDPTHTPTAIPNPTATLKKTLTPTPTKSSTPKLSSSPLSTSSPEELVLGIQNNTSIPLPTPEEGTESEKKFPVFPVILIVAGFLCIAGALFFFVKNNVNKVS